MSDKSSTMSVMSDKSSRICVYPMDVHQYGPSKFPAKSLGAYTQTYRETFQELPFHISWCEITRETAVWSMCALTKSILHPCLGVVFAEHSHTRLEGNAAI